MTRYGAMETGPKEREEIFGELFDVTLGTSEPDPVDFELKEDSNLIFLRLYPLPKVHEQIFKRRLNV